jgi:uncharacterized protein YecT (DUF1311 family)
VVLPTSQEREDGIAKSSAALDEAQAAYIARRKADTADLVRREEAAADFEANRTKVMALITCPMRLSIYPDSPR